MERRVGGGSSGGNAVRRVGRTLAPVRHQLQRMFTNRKQGPEGGLPPSLRQTRRNGGKEPNASAHKTTQMLFGAASARQAIESRRMPCIAQLADSSPPHAGHRSLNAACDHRGQVHRSLWTAGMLVQAPSHPSHPMAVE